MSQPMIVWCTIVGVLLCAFVSNAVRKLREKCRPTGKGGRRLPREVSYCPWDVMEDE